MKTIFESCVVFFILITIGVHAGIFGDLKDSFKDLPKNIIKKAAEKYLPSNNQGDEFSWSDCSAKKDQLVVKSLNISPSIIKYGSTSTISTEFEILKTISAPLEADISIKVKVGDAYIEMCGTFDKCYVPDVCKLLAEKYGKHPSKCPEQLKNMGSNCLCPFAQRSYSLRNHDMYIGKSDGIAFGTYVLNVRLRSRGTEVGCLNLQFCLETCT